MVQVMIRLQNHGKKNHPYWWVVIQSKNKHFMGRIIERVGIWTPRKTRTVDRQISLNTYKIKYWLSVGAQPTDSVHRLLHFAGLLPKKPIPYGSKYLYPQKTKPYSLQYFHTHRWNLTDPLLHDFHHYEKLKKMEAILKTKLQMDNEAINEIVRPRDLNSKYDNRNKEYYTDMNTDEINSDDFDFYSRKRNFDLISKKMNIYFDKQYSLYRGNDYKYNNYIRKLNKLSKGGNIDSEGFKEYIEAVKNLNQSKNSVLNKIGQHYLNELLGRNDFKKEIEELLKVYKTNENNQNDEILKPIDLFSNTAKKDTDSFLEILSRSFETDAKDFFKIKNEDSLKDKEFIHLKNLRIAKILIKLRQSIFQSEKRIKNILVSEDGNLEASSDKIDEEGSTTSNSNSSFFRSIFDNLKTAELEHMPLFDKELYDLIISKHELAENYDDMLFQGINNYLLSTETFQKFKDILFDPEFYGEENLSSETKSKILKNPNIYLLNNNIIDELISSFLDKLSKRYDVNEIYRDEEIDLEEFERNEPVNLKRRMEMDKKLEEMREKHGDFDFLYDDYRGVTEELRNDLRSFKKEYSIELETKFDIKFKKDLRIIKPEMTVGRYDTPEEIEQEKAREEKLTKIEERLRNEILCEKMGEKYIPSDEEAKEELNEEEKKYQEATRTRLRLKYLGPDNPVDIIIPLPDEKRPVIDLKRYLNLVRYKYKKQTKQDGHDMIVLLNKRKLRQNRIYAYSVQQTRDVSRERQEEIKKRFVEYFGKYNAFMYPEGFRHYENFEVYNSVFPNKTIIDYQTECNIFF